MGMRDWFRQFVSIACLSLLKPYCVDRSIGRYVNLRECGFHEAFALNPQIIFQGRGLGIKLFPRKLSRVCSIIVHYLKTDLWKDAKMARQWRRIVGIAEPLIDNMHLLLASFGTCGYNDYMEYVLSPGVQKPQGRIVVYTVLTGDYDHIKDPLYVSPGIDYLLFTNRDTKCKVWKTIKVENEGLTDLLLSRRIKMLPQEYLPAEYDFSVYVDANVIIFGDITMLTTKLNSHCHFAVTAHSVRDSVKDELDELVRLGKVKEEIADSVYARYRAEGFKDDLGLAECTVLVRRCNNECLDSFMRTWWEEFSTNGLYRDQPSLMYCLSNEGYKDYELMEGHVMNNQFCTVIHHKKQQ